MASVVDFSKSAASWFGVAEMKQEVFERDVF